MNIKVPHKILLSLFLILLIQSESFSIDWFQRYKNYNRFYFELDVHGQLMNFNGVNTYSVTGLKINKDILYSVYGKYGYYFLPNVGISAGLGIIRGQNQFSLADYEDKYITTDTENEVYERRIKGTNIHEEQKLGYLYVPVSIDVRKSISETFSYYVEVGVNFAVPTTKNYVGSGTFSYSGYYPAYPILFENLPEYGFPGNKDVVTKSGLKLKDINMIGIASAGVSYFIKKHTQISVGAMYYRSITDFHEAVPVPFHLSEDSFGINSLSGSSTKNTIESLGLNIRIRFFLR